MTQSNELTAGNQYTWKLEKSQVIATFYLCDVFFLRFGTNTIPRLHTSHARAASYLSSLVLCVGDGVTPPSRRRQVFSRTLYMDDDHLLSIWQNYPPHPLQEQEPQGDRKWIDKFPRLQVRPTSERPSVGGGGREGWRKVILMLE